MTHYLAFDLGAESGRAMLGELRSGKLELRELHRFDNTPVKMNRFLYWDLPRLWHEIKVALKKTAAERIAPISTGVDTWGVDFGLLGDDDTLLSNPLHYRNRHTEAVMPRVLEKLGRQRVYDLTGIQIMQFNSLYQLAALAEAQSPALKNAAALLFIGDLLHFYLCGQKRSEFTMATTSQIVDAKSRTWAGELLSDLGIDPRILSPIVEPSTTLGELRSDLVDECDLQQAFAVTAPAVHDTGSAVVSVPAENNDQWCFLSSGTWSLMGVELDGPLISAETMAANYTNEGGVGGTIRFLKNLAGLWLVQECRRHWAGLGRDYSYAELTDLANAAEPFKFLIDPNYIEFASPGDMPGKIAQFCRAHGQPCDDDPGQLVRCCLESLAFDYRRAVENLENLTGRHLMTIHIVGGGSQNMLLNQMTADATGRIVVAGPAEATAIGNVLVQAMGTKEISSLQAARQVVRDSFQPQQFDPGPTGPWDQAYPRFLKVSQSA